MIVWLSISLVAMIIGSIWMIKWLFPTSDISKERVEGVTGHVDASE